MFKYIILPRFNDTDALGHINNATMLTWFEDARRDIFKIFIPDLDIKKWNLILAKIEVSYTAQCNFKDPVEVKTTIKKIGNSSFVVLQKAFQIDNLVAQGETTMVHFDYKVSKASPIPKIIRDQLEKHAN